MDPGRSTKAPGHIGHVSGKAQIKKAKTCNNFVVCRSGDARCLISLSLPWPNS